MTYIACKLFVNVARAPVYSRSAYSLLLAFIALLTSTHTMCMEPQADLPLHLLPGDVKELARVCGRQLGKDVQLL